MAQIITFADILNVRGPPQPKLLPVITVQWPPPEFHEDECPICQEPYALQRELLVKVHPCQHEVGYTCLTEFLARIPENPRCPYCMQPILINDTTRRQSRGMKLLNYIVDSQVFQAFDTSIAELVTMFYTSESKRRIKARDRDLDYSGALKLVAYGTYLYMRFICSLHGGNFHFASILLWGLFGAHPSWLHIWFMRLVVAQAMVFGSIVGCIAYVVVRESKTKQA